MTKAVPAETVWISVARAARILERTPRLIRYYIEEGLLTARRVGPRGWQAVSYADVMSLLNRKT